MTSEKKNGGNTDMNRSRYPQAPPSRSTGRFTWFRNFFLASWKALPDFFKMVLQEMQLGIRSFLYGDNRRLFIQLLVHGKPLQVKLEGKSLPGIHVYNIPNAGLTIGRLSTCAWQFPADDVKISRLHARLVCNRSFSILQRAPIVLRDMNSKYGITVQGVKVQELELKNGVRCWLDYDKKKNQGEIELVVTEEPEDKLLAVNSQTYHRLKQLNGENQGRIYDLVNEVIILGSAPQTDNLGIAHPQTILCEHATVSKNHAMIRITENGRNCKINDMGSRNRTKINADTLYSSLKDGRLLQDRDIISLGYLRFRYYQRDSVAILDYLGAAIFVGLSVIISLTLLYVLIVRFVLPDASDYLQRAEILKSSGQYDKALVMNTKAKDARHKDAYSQEIGDQERSIKRLKDISSKWRNLKVNLLKGNIQTAAVSLNALMQDNGKEAWEGMEKNYEEAQKINALLNNAAKAEELVKDVHPFVEKGIDDMTISRHLTMLKKSKDDFPSELEYLKPLQATTAIVQMELTEMERQRADMGDVLKTLKEQGPSKAMEKATKLQEQISKHIQDMVTQEKIVNRKIFSALNKLCGPNTNYTQSSLELLAQAEDVCQRNLVAVISLEFGKVLRDSPLTGWKMDPSWPTLDAKSEQLKQQHDFLLERIDNVQRNIDTLNKLGMNENNQLVSSAIRNVQNLAPLALECKALQADRKWSKNRKQFIDEYDQLLGLDIFWACLENGVFDTEMQQNEHPLPDLFQARRSYEILNSFHALMRSRPYEDLLHQSPDIENKLLNMVEWARNRLINRAEMTQKWLRQAEKYDKESNVRKQRDALLLTGMACVLAIEAPEIKEDYNRRMGEYLKWRHQLGPRLGHIMEHEREKLLQEVQERGMPGDPIVTDALKTLGRWK